VTATGFMAALEGQGLEMTVLQRCSALPCFKHIKGADQLALDAVCSATDSPFYRDMKNA